MHAHADADHRRSMAMFLALCDRDDGDRLPVYRLFAPIFSSSEALGIVFGGLVIFLVGLVDDVRRHLRSRQSRRPGARRDGPRVVGCDDVLLQDPVYSRDHRAVAVDPSADHGAVGRRDGEAARSTSSTTDSRRSRRGQDRVAIAAGTLCIYGLRRVVELGNLTPDNIGPLVAAIACGVCVGFLAAQLPPGTPVFMGDGGALFLGLVMAAATMGDRRSHRHHRRGRHRTSPA